MIRIILLLLHVISAMSIQQICEFKYGNWSINSYNGPTKHFFECRFSDAQLISEDVKVTTNTAENPKSNKDVQVVHYTWGTVKFIPNSIFEIFPNLEQLHVYTADFVEMKAHYLINADKLRVFAVNSNSLSKLDANLFIEAPNLEYINLQNNFIENIHRLTFNGLDQLEGVYLTNNKIWNIHPETFSHLESLNDLVLLGNTCIDAKYENASGMYEDIEDELERSCSYSQ